MKADHQSALQAEINRAASMAAAGQMSLAVKSFDLAREMAHVWADPDTLETVIIREKSGLAGERDRYRKINFDHGTGEGRVPLLILGDSLGLPRADRMGGTYKGAENTYAWMLGYEVHQYQPTAICQRYFTSDDALSVLTGEPALTQCKAAIIHIGLNDCANRMFLEHERLALSLLPAELRDQIVGFARTYRRAILTGLPSRHYVDVDRFARNLDLLVDRLQRGGCTRILLSTIILPPSRSWPGTPGVNENFGRYNLAVMSAASRNGATLFDINRLVAEHGMEQMLIADGMHLSDAGHTLFTREAVKLLKA